MLRSSQRMGEAINPLAEKMTCLFRAVSSHDMKLAYLRVEKDISSLGALVSLPDGCFERVKETRRQGDEYRWRH